MFGIYLVLGAFAGLMSGLLGIGGGVVVVPALLTIFAHSADIPSGVAMKLAVGTSLATIVVAASSSMLAHHKRGAVRWSFVWRMIPWLGLGSIVGVVIARYLPSTYLKILFSLFLLLISLRLLINKRSTPVGKPVSPLIFCVVSFLIGNLSSILGVGGGVLLVPFLLRCNLEMHEATGTSVACGALVALIATVSFMIAGNWAGLDLPHSTGYIYWPAFWGVAVAGLVFAPLGAMLAHKLSTKILQRVFALFLLIMALDLLI